MKSFTLLPRRDQHQRPWGPARWALGQVWPQEHHFFTTQSSTTAATPSLLSPPPPDSSVNAARGPQALPFGPSGTPLLGRGWKPTLLAFGKLTAALNLLFRAPLFTGCHPV